MQVTALMSPEFSNPLFLKTCCDALNQKSLTAFPKGVNGFVSIFEFYLTAINDKICRMLGRLNSVSIFEFIDAFVDKLFPNSFYRGISIKCTEQIAEDQFGDKQLIDLLVHEGILSYDEFINQLGRKETIVRFTFERYSEHLLARNRHLAALGTIIFLIQKNLMLRKRYTVCQLHFMNWEIFKDMSLIVLNHGLSHQLILRSLLHIQHCSKNFLIN